MGRISGRTGCLQWWLSGLPGRGGRDPEFRASNNRIAAGWFPAEMQLQTIRNKAIVVAPETVLVSRDAGAPVEN
jgi:hypothetical protein